MSRKSIKVEHVKNKINFSLAVSVSSQDTRQGLIWALETILSDTDNYNGFRYLTQDEVPGNELPGIVWVDGKPDFSNTDETRRFYF